MSKEGRESDSERNARAFEIQKNLPPQSPEDRAAYEASRQAAIAQLQAQQAEDARKTAEWRARIAATPATPGPEAGAFEPVDLTQPMSPVEVADVQASSWMAGGDAQSERDRDVTRVVDPNKGGLRALLARLRHPFRRE